MERSPSGPLGNMRIAIVAHVLKYAEADDLLRYLLESQVGETAFIGLPLEFVEGRPGPRLRRFRDGKPTSVKVLQNRKLPPVIQYVADFCLALFWLLTANGRWDLIVACDNLNASAALMTRRLGRARKVVYWTIDFVPERFPQPRLNSLYHRLDRFCLAHADVTWNVSDGIARGREEVRGLRQADYPRQVT